MAKVELKKPIVEEISELLNGAQSAVVVDYRGLTVEQDTRLRKNLREAGCEYKVYKNTLMKRAFEGTDYAQLDSLLEGPSAIAPAAQYIRFPGKCTGAFPLRGQYQPGGTLDLGRMFPIWASRMVPGKRYTARVSAKTRAVYL